LQELPVEECPYSKAADFPLDEVFFTSPKEMSAGVKNTPASGKTESELTNDGYGF